MTYDHWKTRSPDDDNDEPPLCWSPCPACYGEGVVGTGRMSHMVNSATEDPPFEIMETCPNCNGACGFVDEVESDEFTQQR